MQTIDLIVSRNICLYPYNGHTALKIGLIATNYEVKTEYRIYPAALTGASTSIASLALGNSDYEDLCEFVRSQT